MILFPILAGNASSQEFSQLNDVWLFSWLKERADGKHLWARNVGSTAVSQDLDTVIFITLAFWGIMPIWPLILGQYTVKIIIAVADTPFIYLGRRVLGRP